MRQWRQAGRQFRAHQHCEDGGGGNARQHPGIDLEIKHRPDRNQGQSAAEQPPGNGQVKDHGQNHIYDVAFFSRLDCSEIQYWRHGAQTKIEKNKPQKPDRQNEDVPE